MSKRNVRCEITPQGALRLVSLTNGKLTTNIVPFVDEVPENVEITVCL